MEICEDKAPALSNHLLTSILLTTGLPRALLDRLTNSYLLQAAEALKERNQSEIHSLFLENKRDNRLHSHVELAHGIGQAGNRVSGHLRAQSPAGPNILRVLLVGGNENLDTVLLFQRLGGEAGHLGGRQALAPHLEQNDEDGQQGQQGAADRQGCLNVPGHVLMEDVAMGGQALEAGEPGGGNELAEDTGLEQLDRDAREGGEGPHGAGFRATGDMCQFTNVRPQHWRYVITRFSTNDGRLLTQARLGPLLICKCVTT